VSTVIDPSGKFLYVANYGQSGGNSDVSLFEINGATEALTGPVSVADSGGAPTTAIVFHPSGKFAFVTYSWRTSTPVGNTFSDHVEVYSVDASTGQLTGPTSGQTAGSSPWSVVVEPYGHYLYVASLGSDEVRGYAIDSTSGALTFRNKETSCTRSRRDSCPHSRWTRPRARSRRPAPQRHVPQRRRGGRRCAVLVQRKWHESAVA
jgi:DNA-binding beta-propeller fold protein YncE